MTQKAFIGYSHKNKKFKNDLRTHLAVLKQRGKVRDWHDNEILPGDKWQHEINKNLEEADIFLYLVSPHSLASENCNTELMQALKNNQKTRIVLIILDHCDWTHTELEQLQALPNAADGVVPIIDWKSQSRGWKNVTDGIWKIIDADDLTSQTIPPTKSEPSEEAVLSSYVLFSQANFLYLGGQYEKAIEKYSRAIDINPKLTEAYCNRGLAKSNMKNYDEAIADYDIAIGINPKYVDAYNNRGIAKNDLGRYEEAIADCDIAISINPKCAEAYNNRGVAKRGLKNPKGAIADYNKAIDINPQYAFAYNNRGNAKCDLGKPKEAIVDYDKAISINPQHMAAYYNRGNIRLSFGDHKGAIADYSKVIAINPKYAKAYSKRGMVYKKVGDREKACADFLKANALNPECEIPEECKPQS